MLSCYPWALLGMALVVASAFGQEKGEKNAPSSKPDPNTIEVRFADDSMVKMVLQHNSIEVATRYGKLTVPVGEIRRIEFGLRVPEETVKRIDAAIARLASQDFKQRDAASAELLALRELSYPALQQAAKSSDLEVARRAKDAIKLLTDTVSADKLHLPRYDTVVALDFTILGQIEAPVLKARTSYFGETSLKLAEVRSMRWLANDREATVALDAARYGGQQEAWLDTGVEVRAGSGVQVVAGGTVDLRPGLGEAGTYLAGPDGQGQRMTRAAGFGGGGGPGANRGGAAPVRPSGGIQSPGALLGRIGEHGKVFVVGSRYEGTAADDGKLYLRIVASPYNGESTGSYDVRVITGR
jgi:hypothetical protein